MYVVKYTRYTTEPRFHGHLFQFTKKEYEQELFENANRIKEGTVRYVPVSADKAKQYVRDGMTHSTGYWRDGNTIRYASPGF